MTPRPAVPGSLIIRILARLVPADLRGDWIAEWLAELSHCRASPMRTRARALGSLTDALWLFRNGARRPGSEISMLMHDVRFAARSLARRPGYTAVVVATLAFCIGASSAVFGIVESVLLRGLTYRDLGRLVAVWSTNPKEGNDRYQVSVGDYQDARGRARSYESLAGFFPTWNATFASRDAAERLDVGVVSSNFLRTLGVRPALGRDFTDDEDKPGAPLVVILSHAFWTRVFGADPSAVGRAIALDGQLYTVIGVAPADFAFPQNRVDVMVPLPILGSYLTRREVHMLSVVGRLRQGVTLETARSEIESLAAGLREEHPKENAGLGATVRPLADDLLGDVRRPILVLFAAVCAVLLIGCANVTSLMMTRAAGRRQELAVRLAMGAPPRAIARQVLVESALIAGLSAVAGVAIAYAMAKGLSSLLPQAIGRVGAARVDGWVLAFTLIVSAAVALLCGAIPAVRASSGAARQMLAVRGASQGRGARRIYSALVVGELATALVLVVTAGLLVDSFSRLMSVDPGFRDQGIVRMKIALPSGAYPRGPRRDQLIERALAGVAALPGVKSVGFVTRFPLHDGNVTTKVIVEGAAYAPGEAPPSADYRMASAGFFRTMEIPVLAGREFTAADNTDSTSQLTAILNRTAALRLFGTENVVGKRVRLGDVASPLMTVVGVVGDVRDPSPRELPHAQVYISSRQGLPSSGSIVVRYAGQAEPLVRSVRGVIASLDRSLPVFDVQSIEEVLAAASVDDRFLTSLLAGFALFALLLAALGTYGVVAFGVAERTREIGVRMALGARRAEVVAMVLREGFGLFAVALIPAALGAWWAMGAVARLLFEVAPTEPAAIAGAVATLGVTTGLACLVPARRAARVDPMTAIRDTGS